jgi:hypothetical protein
MPSAPLIGLGTSFEYATVAAPTVYTVLAGTEDVKFSGDKVTTGKTTTMQSTNGVDTFIGGTQDPGSVDVKALLLPADASQVGLEAIRLAAQAVNMKALNAITGATRSFSGIVESSPVEYPLDKPCTISYKIKITGPITIS